MCVCVFECGMHVYLEVCDVCVCVWVWCVMGVYLGISCVCIAGCLGLCLGGILVYVCLGVCVHFVCGMFVCVCVCVVQAVGSLSIRHIPGAIFYP